MYHHDLAPPVKQKSAYIWEMSETPPFDELLISWNAGRPQTGGFIVSVSVFTDDWSPWMVYAQWEAHSQKSVSSRKNEAEAWVDQDAVCMRKKATGFRVRLQDLQSDNLDYVDTLHVCATDLSTIEEPAFFHPSSFLYLDVPGLSQMALQDSRRWRLCSPTSITALLDYFTKSSLDPISIAEACWDEESEIFGNWVLNIAAAYEVLRERISRVHCWVERLKSFDDVLDSLHRGIPLVISVRGPLQGSALDYKEGHLLVVAGYDPITDQVICMDPAFPTDDETHVRYDRENLCQAWARRKNVAYVFRSI